MKLSLVALAIIAACAVFGRADPIPEDAYGGGGGGGGLLGGDLVGGLLGGDLLGGLLGGDLLGNLLGGDVLGSLLGGDLLGSVLGGDLLGGLLEVPTQVLGGALDAVSGLAGGLIGGVVDGVLQGVLKDCVGGLFSLDLSKLLGGDLIKGLLGTVVGLVGGLLKLGKLTDLKNLPNVQVKDGEDLNNYPGGAPMDPNLLPKDPLKALQLACPLIGVLGALVSILASIVGLATGVVGAVVTLAHALTSSLPVLGELVPNLGGLCTANIVQLVNLNVLLNLVCKDVLASC